MFRWRFDFLLQFLIGFGVFQSNPADVTLRTFRRNEEVPRMGRRGNSGPAQSARGCLISVLLPRLKGGLRPARGLCCTAYENFLPRVVTVKSTARTTPRCSTAGPLSETH